MQNPDQRRVEAFLREFASRLAEKQSGKIDFILLFGSAALGEFVKGKSNVDLLIQVKEDAFIPETERLADHLFWELDQKYGLGLKEVCSTGEKKNALEGLLKLLESGARLNKPFEVMGPWDISWETGEIVRADLAPGAWLVASQYSLLYKMKTEGKILWGRNILPEIRPKATLWEKAKGAGVPQHLALAGLLVAWVLPEKGVAYASKTLLYELESALLFLGKFRKGKARQMGLLEKEEQKKQAEALELALQLGWRSRLGREQRLFREAMEIKQQGWNRGRREGLAFCFRAWLYILSTNSWLFLKALLEGEKAPTQGY